MRGSVQAKGCPWIQHQSQDEIFRKGDLVWRLAPNWEGSFHVQKSLSNGAYWLEHLSNKEISRTYNLFQLKQCKGGVLFPTTNIFP